MPDPYKSVKSPRVNIGKLAKYAKENAKDGWTLTKEEIEMFENNEVSELKEKGVISARK